MNILFYDSETTGIPDWKNPSESPSQPHLVDLAALLYTDQGELIGQMETLIKPDGWVIPQDCIDVHGITNELAAAEGIDEAAALGQFMALHDQAGLRIAHNRTFDDRLIRIALKRFGGETVEARDLAADEYKAKPGDCTMWLTKEICKLPGKGAAYKLPKLTEAYRHFFPGEEVTGAHRAMADARACARIYFKVKHDLDIGA